MRLLNIFSKQKQNTTYIRAGHSSDVYGGKPNLDNYTTQYGYHLWLYKYAAGGWEIRSQSVIHIDPDKSATYPKSWVNLSTEMFHASEGYKIDIQENPFQDTEYLVTSTPLIGE